MKNIFLSPVLTGLICTSSILVHAQTVKGGQPAKTEGSSVSPVNAEPTKPEPSKAVSTRKSIPESSIWLGAGFYYLVYQQKTETTNVPVDYRGFSAPSLWLDFRQKLYKNFGLRLEYLSQSGSKAKSESLILEKKDISWSYSTIGFDYLWNRTFKWGDYFLQPSYLFAYQTHTMPFLKQNTSNKYSIESIKFSSLSLGYFLSMKYSPTSSFFITNRLQAPVSSGTDIKVNSGVSFDGAIGYNYQLASNWATAVFWGGQYHRLKYKYLDEVGDYVLLTSKLNVLIGTSW